MGLVTSIYVLNDWCGNFYSTMFDDVGCGSIYRRCKSLKVKLVAIRKFCSVYIYISLFSFLHSCIVGASDLVA